jgi:hypothetical protein
MAAVQKIFYDMLAAGGEWGIIGGGCKKRPKKKFT